jgi:serine/threonine protein kinase
MYSILHICDFFFSTLDHPNVVKFFGVTHLQNQLCIVTELLTLGSLRTVMDNQGGHLEWPLCLRLLKGVAKGMYVTSEQQKNCFQFNCLNHMSCYVYNYSIGNTYIHVD